METIIYVAIQRYTSKEIAKIYNTSYSSFNKDIKPYRHLLGERIGYRWSVEQVKMIFDLLGKPFQVIEHDKDSPLVKFLPPKTINDVFLDAKSDGEPDKVA